MKINVIGTRGFPNIQGGVEKHCESIYPILGAMNCEVKIFRRKPYLNKKNIQNDYSTIKFQDLWTVKRKSLEALLHSILASLICLYERPDILHIHNIGPSLVLPLMKTGRINTVVTYHSANYEHRKWGKLAQKILKIGEKFVYHFADEIIFVSKTQYDSCKNANKKYIPNGVNIPTPSSGHDFLSKIGATPSKYILFVGRFTPEKGLELLIKAFKGLNIDHKLVIVGDTDHESIYSRDLKRTIALDDRIIHTGYITGEPLNQVFSHARLFVLPSYHEGLPIALLEAMSYGLSVLVSDIQANLEVNLPAERYFQCGNVSDLKQKMSMLLEKEITDREKRDMRIKIAKDYNWLKIAEQTIAVYEKALQNGRNSLNRLRL